MAGTIVADQLEAASTSTLVIKNGVANTPPTVQDSAGTQIGTFCRAWVNFNGTTVTSPASMTGVRGSFNITSILDNGTGDYTVNFTTAMPDANYSCIISVSNSASNTTITYIKSSTTPTTSLVRVACVNSGAAAVDPDYVNVSIFR